MSLGGETPKNYYHLDTKLLLLEALLLERVPYISNSCHKLNWKVLFIEFVVMRCNHT